MYGVAARRADHSREAGMDPVEAASEAPRQDLLLQHRGGTRWWDADARVNDQTQRALAAISGDRREVRGVCQRHAEGPKVPRQADLLPQHARLEAKTQHLFSCVCV